jgi:hypothetical protein
VPMGPTTAREERVGDTQAHAGGIMRLDGVNTKMRSQHQDGNAPKSRSKSQRCRRYVHQSDFNLLGWRRRPSSFGWATSFTRRRTNEQPGRGRSCCLSVLRVKGTEVGFTFPQYSFNRDYYRLPESARECSEFSTIITEMMRLKNGKPHRSPSPKNRKIGSDCSFHASELLENCSFSDRAGNRTT